MTGITSTCLQHADSENQWQQLLDTYCDYEQRHKRLLQWRALGYALLFSSAAVLVFLLGSASHYHSYWLVAAVIGVVLALPLTFHCQLALGKVERRRRNISRKLFDAGLRVDEDYHLLTNTAHPKLVAKTGRIAGSQ